MNKRFIKNIDDLSFEPFDNYGESIKGMSWHKLSYDKSNGGFGTYILKMDAGAKSLAHIHQGYEEFYVIDGELQDADGKIFKKGDFVTFEPGSEHNSHTKNGCLLIVFMRGINKPI
jgi:anti-sigma factor ChrR (cupin superfamily)